MLPLALKAGLPLIKVTTDDTVNFYSILKFYADNGIVTIIEEDEAPKLDHPGFHSFTSIYYILEPKALNYATAYKACVSTEKTLVIVNPEEDSPIVFNAGRVQLPKEMLFEFLAEIAEEDNVQHLMSTLGGLSLKDVAEVCRLCMAKHDSLTPRGVTDVRRMYMSNLSGIQQVDTRYTFYSPMKELTEWLGIDGAMFTREDIISELVPRGLLFGGGPGLGKTMAAKYLANELEVPLFRLDLGGMMNKYVGQSEGNLASALTQLDQSEPCIVLIDEVEKVFKSTDDSGVTSRLLSQLLWWLQEHTSRVVTILTTNNTDSLPKELYRPGRIDKTVVFRGLDKKEGRLFIKLMVNQYEDRLSVPTKAILARLTDLYAVNTQVSQSELAQLVFQEEKKYLIENNI